MPKRATITSAFRKFLDSLFISNILLVKIMFVMMHVKRAPEGSGPKTGA
jgi:hypothetical protein